MQHRLADLRASLPAGRLPAPSSPDAVDGEFWNGWLGARAGAGWLDLSFFEAEVLFYHLVLAAVGYVDERARSDFPRYGHRAVGEPGRPQPALDLERQRGAPHRRSPTRPSDPAGGATSFTVDYVLDNAGSELLGDLVLIDAILAASPGARMRVHGKPFPFFVSDATLRDCREAMAHLERHADVATSAWADGCRPRLPTGGLSSRRIPSGAGRST